MWHNFHAGVGGSAFDTNDPGTHPYIKGSPRLTVTAQGAPILAEHGRLPDISKVFIGDKSKADEIAKSLAIIQATCLLTQCSTRGCRPSAFDLSGDQYPWACHTRSYHVSSIEEEAI